MLAMIVLSPLSRPAFSQTTTLQLNKVEAERMADFLVNTYRINIVRFAKEFESYTDEQKKEPEKLKDLFRKKVLSSLTLVKLNNWKLPRFIFSGKENFVVNKDNLPNMDDKEIKANKKSKEEKERYAIELDVEQKKEYINVLKTKPIYVTEDKAKENYIIGINLIPNNSNDNNEIRDVFNELKTDCFKCHMLISPEIKKTFDISNSDLKDLNLKDLSVVVIFEIPIEGIKLRNSSN